MEETLLLYTILSTFFLLVAIKCLVPKKHKNLPPSPPALPIIGHLHLLKQPFHKTLHNLSQKYGPIITLRFGDRLAIIVSSPPLVEECLTKNDIIFANRPSYAMPKYTDYNQTTLATTNYGDHWRNLRRICTIEILSSQRLSRFQSIRKDEVSLLLHRLHSASCQGGFAKVGLRPLFMSLTTNIIMRMVAGKRYYGEDEKGTEEAQEFKKILEEYIELVNMTNLGELIPILKRFYSGTVKKYIRLGGRIDSFLQGLVNEQRIDRDRDTMINHLLALQELEPDYHSDEIIKGLILIMVMAGSESTAAALEWAVANLLNNPSVLEKAKAEIDTKIGEDRLIGESDLPELRYLQSVVYENLRLTPVVPVLAPHLSSKDCTVGGYHVPANTMLLINTWAIQRDPNLWNDPTSFKPERFEDGKMEGFKFLAFGFGRRACPGDKLAFKEMGLSLGSMIQCFEWKRVGGKEIDMSETKTILMSKVVPLEVMCRPRPILQKVLP